VVVVEEVDSEVEDSGVEDLEVVVPHFEGVSVVEDLVVFPLEEVVQVV
jgi:hypothetical protein